MVSVALCSKATEQPRVEVPQKIQLFVGRGGSLCEILWSPVQLQQGNLQQEGLGHIPGEVVPAKACSYCKNCFFMLTQNPSQCYLYCCSLFSPRGSLWAEMLCPLCISTVNAGIMWWTSCSPGRRDPAAPVSPHSTGSQALWSPVSLLDPLQSVRVAGKNKALQGKPSSNFSGSTKLCSVNVTWLLLEQFRACMEEARMEMENE